MGEQDERFSQAKAEYQILIEKDFPGFDLESYAQEKALMDKQSGESDSEASAQGKSRKKMGAKLDADNDGRLGLGDVVALSKSALGAVRSAGKATGRFASSAAKGAKDAVVTFDAAKAASDTKVVLSKAGKAIADIDVGEIADNAKGVALGAGKAISRVDVSGIAASSAKIAKTAVGVQGIQNRSEAKGIKATCDEYYQAAEAITEERRRELNYAITDFGEYRLRALHQTIGRFLEFLKALKQNNKVKEYEILAGTDIDTKTLEQMESIDMAASQALRSTAITGAFGAAAVMGTPALVTGAVGALATASTGTAISSLSGAAASNAVLAWLGGGSIAAGGGGMAAGAAVLTAATAGVTAVAAILSAGIIVSVHYSKKLTEAKEYEKDVGVAVANLEKAWIIMDGVGKRTAELREVTEELKWRTNSLLEQLEPLIPNFDFTDAEQVIVFNKSAQLVKTMVELAQTPLLGDDGNLSMESMTISAKIRKVLNTEV